MIIRPRQPGPLLLLLAIGSLWGCTRARLEVQLLGCTEEISPRVCELPADRMLRLLCADVPAGPVAVCAGDRVLLRDVRGTGGERLLLLAVPAGVTSLRVEAGATSSGAYTLREAPAIPAIKDARAKVGAGKLREAAAALEEGLSRERAPDARARMLADLAKLERRQDQSDRAIGHMKEALDADRRVGHIIQRASHAATLSFILAHHQRRYAEARQVLAAHRDAFEHDPDQRSQADYFEGLIDLEMGDLRSAVERFHRAGDRAVRTSYFVLLGDIRSLEAVSLEQLGKPREALAVFSSLLNSPTGGLGCARMEQLLTLAEIQLRAIDVIGPAATGDPMDTLHQAQEFSESPRCKNPRAEVNIKTWLAYAAMQRKDLDAARGHLAQARSVQRDLGEKTSVDREMEWLDLDGQVALATGAFDDALKAYRKLATRARGISPAAQWRATYGQAQALLLLGHGKEDEALAAFRRGEELLDQRSTVVSMVDDWSTFLASHEQASRAYLAALLDRGRAAEALLLVRHLYARKSLSLRLTSGLSRLSEAERGQVTREIAAYSGLLKELDELPDEDWVPGRIGTETQVRRPQLVEKLRQQLGRVLERLRLAEDPLWPAARPPPGTVLVACHPLPAGWACLAQDDQGVQPAMVPTLSKELLAEFSGKLSRAHTLRVLSEGELIAIDFEAWPGTQGPPLSGLMVVRVLDGASLAGGKVPAIFGARAFVLCNPEGNLPYTAGACPEVARLLEHGGKVDLRLGEGRTGTSAVWPFSELGALLQHRRRSRVASTAVREQVGQADVFVYIGHAHFAGWLSALHLSDKTALHAGDVLLLPRVPDRVTLLGCETAGSRKDITTESGLAQAFLYRGSTAVVATARPTSERAAVDLALALYRHEFHTGDPVRAFRLAQEELRQHGEEWAAFRLFIR